MLNYALRHEDLWGSGGINPHFQNLTGGERSASRPGHITAGKRAYITHWIGGYRGSNTNPSVVNSIASRYTD
jgi:hypothetical protein